MNDELEMISKQAAVASLTYYPNFIFWFYILLRVKLLSVYSVDPLSHAIIIIVLVYTAKYSINTLCVQAVILPYKNRIKIYLKKAKEKLKY
jgi:hypothetical protein